MTPLDVSTPEQLSTLLEGRSDAEVLELCAEAGIEAVVEQILASMLQRFRPDRAPPGTPTVQWNIETPMGRRPFALKVEGGKCSIERAVAAAPRVTLNTTLPVFMRVIAGRLNGLQAFSDGELRVAGDLVLALEHQLWFDVDLSQAQLTISRPSELAKLITGRSDEEVEAGIAITGVDAALAQVFRGMVEYYVPRKGPSKRTVVEFSVRTKQGDRVYQLVVDPKGASFHTGSRDSANVTLMLRTGTFLRIAAGTLDGLVALAQGRIKLRGNLFVARNVQGWFDLKA